jgi:hypothetical protein
MLTKDIYGKTLSNDFSSAINAYGQVVKPRIIMTLLDSRHMSNVTITNTDNHTVNSNGSLGYFFTKEQVVNGVEREAITWAVCDAKTKNGSVIRADGSYHTCPSDLEDNFEFGWWSKTKSQANGVFASSPEFTINFDNRKVNKVRVTTSETYGQVKSFRIRVQNTGGENLIDKTVTLETDEYYKDLYLKSNVAYNSNFQASRIILSVISTKNGSDYARVHEVSPIYEVDITDDVIDYSVSRTRDVHESSLPIGGTQSPKVTIKLDNTQKDWSVFNNNSLYGKYLKKDLKIEVATGWRIKKTTDSISNTYLTSSLSNSATTLNVLDSAIFPSGGVSNNFIVVVDPDNENREIILCNNVSSSSTVAVSERGYGDSDAVAHSSNALVQFDPYEYVSMGTYYVDEYSMSSNDMVLSITASDFSKFLTEKNLDKGFLLQNRTVGEAVHNLIMRANFPNKMFKHIVGYSKSMGRLGAVARYSFSEDAIDKNGNIVAVENGFRVRFWGMPDGKQSDYKTLRINLLEKNLSIEEKIEFASSNTSPDYTIISTAAPAAAGKALSYTNYTFQSIKTSVTHTKYFNGVADGYYIPLWNGNQDLVLSIKNGAARVYLDDVLIIESMSESTTTKLLSAYTYRGNNFLNLTAGVPYRLRIEFYHGPGDANFCIDLYKNNSSLNNQTHVLDSEVRSVVARDGLGTRNALSSPASYDLYDIDIKHHQNDGILSSNVQLSYSESLTTEENNRGILLIDGGHVRIPNHSSIAIGEKDFTIEFIAKFHNGHFDTGDGEYLSTWSNSNPTNGYEFYFNNNASHGIKLKTNTSTILASGTTELLVGNFYHIVATYNSSNKKLSYYVNGTLESSTTVTGNVVTQTQDITIGGRGAYFTANTGPTAPATAREFILDEFAFYTSCLTQLDVTNRYVESQVTTPTQFQYLYSDQGHVREAIDTITLADLGRFYIDEEGYGRYEHYNRFFEKAIDQHANVQASLSDTTNIVDSDMQVQLQVNKVTVKVSSVASLGDQTSTLWTPPDKTTLAVVKLTATLLSDSDSMAVSSTTEPVFSNNGYLALSKVVNSETQTEIIKYSGKTNSSFIKLERGQFNTTALEFEANTKVREARYYEINYDKAPAVGIKDPYFDAILDEEPDLINILKFDYTPYTAKLIIAASNSVNIGDVVYASGTHPVTQKEYAGAIAGIPVMVTQGTEKVSDQVQSLTDNIKKYGLKEITIDSPYITNIDHAKNIATFIISKMSEPVPVINVNIMSIPTIQLGDRVIITSLDQFDIIGSVDRDQATGEYLSTTGHYWVISQEFSYGETLTHSLVLRKVV